MKQKLSACLLSLITLSLLFPPAALGWGEQGHLMAGRVAAMKLPKDMPKFFRKSVDQLSYLNPDPDRWRDRGESNLLPTLNAATAPDHYIDIEIVPEGALNSPDRYAFMNELIKAGRKPNEAGFLPYRIIEVFQRLRVEFRLWRQEKDSKRRDWIEQRIIDDAGILGHYVADGSNPHHTTIHHNGWVGDNPKGYTTERDFHFRFEAEYVRTHIQPNDLLPKISNDARVIDQPREAVIRYLRESRSKLEELYELEKREKFGPDTKSPDHKNFAATQLAAGAQMLRDLWWTAWMTSTPIPNPVAQRTGE